ncbi:hypothetical protein OHV05_15740 [Kitasatospora sp. NBC_00070]|uniref:hypothetical protein n=1 Tax=Kitasatospora sp. NBC_00070 TaxID=2975962 RepID=UPI0032468F8C
MSTNRSRRIDRATAEQLLAGAPADPSAGQDRLAGRTVPTDHAALAGLIASAAAPEVGGGELPGEQAALTAFRSVRDQSTAAPRRRTTMAATATARARAFSAKALLVAGVATALGGVAVAAGAHLPGGRGGGQAVQAPVSSLPSATAPWTEAPTGQPFSLPSATPPAARSRSAGPSPSRSTADPVVPSGAVSPPGTPPGTPGTPGTSAAPAELERLCRTLGQRLLAGDRAKALAGDPAFAPLIAAAGKPEDVPEYCARLLGGALATKSPGGRGGKTDPPDGHPTREGSDGADRG